MTNSGDVDVVVIGAGQAGLSTAWALARQGFEPGTGFVVLDADDAPGGAWQHRWPSLTLATTHRVHDLPGLPFEQPDADTPAVDSVPAYFAEYERRFALPVHRPVRVRAVHRTDDDRFRVETGSGDWTARAIVNATGTWTRPFVPRYPGQELFGGRQLHTVDYREAAAFAGQHVVVVGGGASATQLLGEISTVATTTWVTRRPPVWRDGPFDEHVGREVVAKVDAAVREGGAPAASSASPACSSPRPTSVTASRGVSSSGCRCSTGSPRTASSGRTAGASGPTRSSGPPGSGPPSRTWPRCGCARPAAASGWTAPRSPVNRASTWSATALREHDRRQPRRSGSGPGPAQGAPRPGELPAPPDEGPPAPGPVPRLVPRPRGMRRTGSFHSQRGPAGAVSGSVQGRFRALPDVSEGLGRHRS
ncbi:FAD-dependent oxidoreductase [Blastococcus brunescens]|uniref:FAD-dependent oxidoreductase n=1 Tax=Blastococcus brunescens TaxID=1564165 RepID=A0ABZ1B347_9ACTN|nr:FAD-dependent oxidoreductase [Blastococcus sp. BMG 8361]WRL65232.1 FAD-dependent oxidoreductase [Blastococcus sp. BMG 8361]